MRFQRNTRNSSNRRAAAADQRHSIPLSSPAEMDDAKEPFSGKADIETLSTSPWFRRLLDDPKYLHVSTDPRRFGSYGENLDTFMGQTLATKDTIRACLALRPKASSRFDGVEVSEILVPCDLGPKLGGNYSVAHGGLITTLLDHFMAMLIRVNKQVSVARGLSDEADKAYVTLKLEASYLKAVPTPGKVVVRAKYDRIEGRKRWLKGTIEDDTGTVLARGQTLFLQVPNKALRGEGSRL